MEKAGRFKEAKVFPSQQPVHKLIQKSRQPDRNSSKQRQLNSKNKIYSHLILHPYISKNHKQSKKVKKKGNVHLPNIAKFLCSLYLQIISKHFKVTPLSPLSPPQPSLHPESCLWQQQEGLRRCRQSQYYQGP